MRLKFDVILLALIVTYYKTIGTKIVTLNMLRTHRVKQLFIETAFAIALDLIKCLKPIK